MNFRNPEEVANALKMDKRLFGPKFGQRYVSVLLHDDITSKSSRKTLNGQNHEFSSSRSIVRLDYLPKSTSKEDIQHLLWGTNISKSHISLVAGHSTGKTFALIYLESEKLAANAIDRWNGTVITTTQGSFRLKMSFACDYPHDQRDTILKMRGLPIRIEEGEIEQFFEDCSIKTNGIHIQPATDTKHSKVAFVEFKDLESFRKALVCTCWFLIMSNEVDSISSYYFILYYLYLHTIVCRK